MSKWPTVTGGLPYVMLKLQFVLEKSRFHIAAVEKPTHVVLDAVHLAKHVQVGDAARRVERLDAHVRGILEFWHRPVTCHFRTPERCAHRWRESRPRWRRPGSVT